MDLVVETAVRSDQNITSVKLFACAVWSGSENKRYKLVSLDLHLKWLQLQSHTPYLFPNYMPVQSPGLLCHHRKAPEVLSHMTPGHF